VTRSLSHMHARYTVYSLILIYLSAWAPMISIFFILKQCPLRWLLVLLFFFSRKKQLVLRGWLLFPSRFLFCLDHPQWYWLQACLLKWVDILVKNRVWITILLDQVPITVFNSTKFCNFMSCFVLSTEFL
jgi:hypothetical protein